MKLIAVLSFVGCGLGGAAMTGWQDAGELKAPKAASFQEHRRLQKLAGKWTYEAEGIPGPGQTAVKTKGTETVRALGDYWIIAEGAGKNTDGAPMTTLLTLGFDRSRQKYVGAWVCSCMSELWTYQGTMDASGKLLTLETEGPNIASPGKLAKYRDVIEFKSDDHRVHTSSIQSEDGQWFTFVTANYRRSK